MTKLIQNKKIMVVGGLIVFLLIFILYLSGKSSITDKSQKVQSFETTLESNDQTWDQRIQKVFAESGMDEFNFTITQMIEKSESEAETDALKKVQVAYDNDNLDDVSFEDYKIPLYEGSLAMINPKISSSGVNKFITVSNWGLEKDGINFAGKYTITEIPMTGWRGNYVIVDRTNGKGVTIPYEILNIETRPDSTLIKVNPKKSFNISTCLSPNSDVSCEISDYLDMRPYYYVWDGTSLKQLGNPAPKTEFWERWGLK